ncbi:hypothetical protein RDI58_000946 [Solanum bulbocastanum]|uniref:RNase H type-1 domain-containing protein n=1 Tax=Solanum bulbocastanum TaxID=147425 RepID=A0AAN8YSU4_SOLBU
MVSWHRPPEKWVKINTDGRTIGSLGRIGAGGIIRDHNGEMVLAYTTPLKEGNSNQAEVGAAIFGISWTLQMRLRRVILEVDSQPLVD